MIVHSKDPQFRAVVQHKNILINFLESTIEWILGVGNTVGSFYDEFKQYILCYA
jgi:hypothetical protein